MFTNVQLRRNNSMPYKKRKRIPTQQKKTSNKVVSSPVNNFRQHLHITLDGDRIKSTSSKNYNTSTHKNQKVKKRKRLVDLNFKVEPEFKLLYQLCAQEADLKNVQLLKSSIKSWIREHGSKKLKNLGIK